MGKYDPSPSGWLPLNPSPQGNYAQNEGMGVSHACHTSLLKLKERSLLCMAGVQIHLLIRKLPCTLATVGSITVNLHPSCAEMSHSGQSRVRSPDGGALTPYDLSWVFYGARAQGLSASQPCQFHAQLSALKVPTHIFPSPGKGLAD